MHLGGVARSAGGAERKSRGREGEKFLIYTGPEGKPGGESRFQGVGEIPGSVGCRLEFAESRSQGDSSCAAPLV